uniref:Mitochondrial carrier protein n=1 Tax=Trieres chinensis TaxID=1514140 RepID=A0A7S1ZBJ0_TRICV|mmetsp:Transcript_21746/g.44015  ORF Transcript_21746/g.44015 Transcript_21746/m.44015 type:complete len:269 (+) Transcript_21746:230-1036(+)|eukprot:CAMPEP_0183326408 /NCGR_PEP_ID=MMETSP0160_2-20130417/82073_1 /TAXON_ID=2839 ORGANISM="Odontella Sinensis, Strain Grunow 1884" /NCGR_SAMPLE_ID=MMETSP0160_2 /ASSEMBLY_ACC=CAM_ASM_000250 /LENGTH=268 /DNA_ID=CAMNT_0025494383 /DNA_START=161 /DNA_END=967 /DNA_ORIENTATION=+
MSTKLNEFENATVGASVGTVEVLCLQSFNYAKNMIQQGQPISLDPRKMYRGVGANCVNMGSCTMIQFAVGGSLKKMVTGGDAKRQLKPHEEMGCGIVAGVVSALVGSPLELIMIQQQRKGGSTLETLKNISTPGTFMRGFVGAAVREGLWTCGYLSIPPIVRRTLMENYPETFDSQQKARVPAALLGGLFACYLTHPFDTVKTCMQGDIERKTFGSFTETSKALYKESGFPAFYRGATFRYGRMVCAVALMDYLQAMIGPLLYPAKFA